MPKKIKKTTKTAKRAKKDLQKKLNMFDRLPDECSACSKHFDKKDKNMVMSWNVVVKSEENLVRLYCPDCWKKATTRG
jgi:hypothetical protein